MDQDIRGKVLGYRSFPLMTENDQANYTQPGRLGDLVFALWLHEDDGFILDGYFWQVRQRLAWISRAAPESVDWLGNTVRALSMG